MIIAKVFILFTTLVTAFNIGAINQKDPDCILKFWLGMATLSFSLAAAWSVFSG